MMYICVEKSKEEFDINGESLGQSGKSALYYSTSIGRSRVYRQSYPYPRYKGLRLFTYKNKNNAQRLCDYTNKQFGNNYEVIEVKE